MNYIFSFYVNSITHKRQWGRKRYTDRWKIDPSPQHWFDPITKRCYIYDRNQPEHKEWVKGCINLELPEKNKYIYNYIKSIPYDDDDNDDHSYQYKCNNHMYDIFLPDNYMLVNGIIQQNKTAIKSILQYKEGKTGEYKICYKGNGSGVLIKHLLPYTIYKYLLIILNRFRLRYYDPVSGVYSMYSRPLCIETPDASYN